MTEPTIPVDAIRQAFQAGTRVWLCTHENPDGDAIGSLLGMSRLLAQQGIHVRPVSDLPIPQKFAFLAQDGEIGPVPSPTSSWQTGAAALVVLGCGVQDRAPPFARGSCPVPLVNIDHHPSNPGFGAVHYVDSTAACTTQLVYRIVQALGWPITRAIAEPLWVGMVTDSGRFSFDSTSPELLRIGADLLEKGIATALIDEQIYGNRQMREMQLMGRALLHLALHADGKIASIYLTEEDFRACHCTPEHAEGTVTLARNLAGVEVALYFCEPPGEGITKVSVRTKPPYDACVFCAQFAGGGHARAAGCKLNLPLATTMEKVLAAAHQWFA